MSSWRLLLPPRQTATEWACRSLSRQQWTFVTWDSLPNPDFELARIRTLGTGCRYDDLGGDKACPAILWHDCDVTHSPANPTKKLGSRVFLHFPSSRRKVHHILGKISSAQFCGQEQRLHQTAFSTSIFHSLHRGNG